MLSAWGWLTKARPRHTGAVAAEPPERSGSKLGPWRSALLLQEGLVTAGCCSWAVSSSLFFWFLRIQKLRGASQMLKSGPYILQEAESSLTSRRSLCWFAPEALHPR